MPKKYKPNPKRNRMLGSFRVEKIVTDLYSKYQGVPNFTIIPKYEFGTGCDIIAYEGVNNHILELHEVTNWKRYTFKGHLIKMIEKRFNYMIGNLVQPKYRIYGSAGQITLYPTITTHRFLHVSYKDCLSKSQIQTLKSLNIQLIEWQRTDLLHGYFTESKRRSNRVTRTYYDNNGNLKSKKIIKFK